MSNYQIQAVESLLAESDDALTALRRLERAERLAGKLDSDSKYQAADLIAEIVGDEAGKDRSDSDVEHAIEGELAIRDLRRFVEDMSETVNQSSDEVGEDVFTVDDLSREFQVSTKTIDRWRDRGLVSRRMKVGDRRRVAFTRSSVDRFVRNHPDEIERGRRFTQLTGSEKDEIVDAARALAREGGCPAEVSRSLAKRFNRSPETIRYTIRQHDEKGNGPAVFPNASSKLTDQQKQEIASKHRRGVSIERLAKQFCRTKSSVYRIVNEIRAERLLSEPIDYMDSPEFHEVGADELILGEPPDVKKKKGVSRAPSGLPPYLASLYTIPLLTREEEQYYFRKLNYLRYRAAALQAKLMDDAPKASEMDELEHFLNEANDVKNFLIRSNLRLVVSIAKKQVSATSNFFEMVSDGNMSLIRAVEKFDYTKGNKFSTYATWAIVKNFSRSIPAEHKRLDRYRTGKEEVFQGSPDDNVSQYQQELRNTQQHGLVMDILGRLDGRERDIIKFRYGLDYHEEPLTLEQVGHRFGVTKERIRQLESRALRKLRKIAQDERLDIPGIV
ncbi:sigma-70 family RNA polymerase sigma factor [Stratiformator vulcanicus]|uniref:RNA polymerase sigma factor SigA n=1 Tax=Stratiformator vulcanicus TaxID=2527980 RepID=A0A517R0F8_9PLAN|nr:sigma-70 family RNA polymerase sigma factor [Stratiformator vulcanicus]QDT37387.1 RNA polymerase sigma factor SigA [Stratiformator vulcanicus]